MTASVSEASPHGYRMPNLKGQLPEVTLTAAETKMWDDTRVALLWHCPAFAHIFYTMLDNTKGKQVALFTEHEDIPIAATDGHNLIFKPSTFFKLTLNERLFVAAHEIMHCILNHCNIAHMYQQRGKVVYEDGSELGYDHQLMNKAEDYVINDILVESKVGTFVKSGLHDKSIGTAADSALDVYKKLYKDNPAYGGKGKLPGNTEDAASGGFDILLSPGCSVGKDPGQAVAEHNQGAWDMAIAEGANSARLQGKLPAGLDRMFGAILNPKVDWRDKIRSLFARKAGSGGYDFRRADRRLIVRDIYSPSRSGFGCGPVVVGVDTSGSIGKEELDMFMAEMAGILDDCEPEKLYICWCDAAIGRVDEAEDTGDLMILRAKGAPGGGGTSFIPVFDWIKEMNIQPAALVYLTDGMGRFPNTEPSYPVIWGNIYPNAKYPFGDVVDIPKQV